MPLPPQSARRFPAACAARQGGVVRSLALLLLLGTAGGSVWMLPSFFGGEDDADYLTCRAELTEFNFDIVERGELESSASLEVRCEVQSQDGRGTKILEIVPEGTQVQEGDLLIRFDDSGLRNERTLQEIAVNTAQAALTQAKNELESAEFAKQEYELGVYKQEYEKAESELFLARENLERAEAKFEYRRQLARKGFASQSEVDADSLAAAKCRRELSVAETKLVVLRDYTKIKTLRKHDADIDTAKAKLKSEQAKLQIETDKLKLIDEQILKCVVRAPRAGQVIYDHSQDRWGGNDNIIKEGAFVYERRVVIEMPDPAQMQVKAKIPESRIDKLKTGMEATIEVEGLPGVKLSGVVTKINSFPAEGNWYNSSVKQYETTIDIPDPPRGLRPGMTAQVAIRAEHLPQALQVPLQAVAEMNGGHYCLRKQPDGALRPCAVLPGSANESYLVIREGLAANDELVLDPRERLTKLKTLPSAIAARARPSEPVAGSEPVGSPRKDHSSDPQAG